MANLSNYVRITSSYASTGTSTGGAGFGTTGDPIAFSTAAAAGSTTVSGGGYPVSSTVYDLQDFEGIVGVATYYAGTTGGGAGTSGINTLQFYVGDTTSGTTAFNPIQGAYATAYTTQPGALVLDVYRPKGNHRYGTFQFQLASSSNIAYSITAIQYGAKSEAISLGNSTRSTVATLSSIVASGISLAVSGTT